MNSLLSELRKVPMLPLALAVAAGVQFGLHLDLEPRWLFWTCVGTFLLAIGAGFTTRSQVVWTVGLLVFLASLGAFRATLGLERNTRFALTRLAAESDQVVVWGRVDLPASDSPGHDYVTLRVSSVSDGPTLIGCSRLRLRLFADSVSLSGLRHDDVVYASGRLAAGRDLYPSRGALTGALVRKLGGSVYSDSSSIFVAAGRGQSLRRVVDDIREYARTVFRRNLNPDGAAICNALLLGDRGQFGTDFSNDLRLTGLSHIFALSGMNTGLILLIVWLFICWLPIPHSIRLLILLGAVLFYMEIGREAPSLVRSSLVAAAIILGNLLHRRAVFLNLVFAAAFVELLWKPLDLIDAGFLLSYSAVLGIVGSYPWIRMFLLRPWTFPGYLVRSITKVAAAAGAAQLGTMPLVAYYFHRIPITGVLGNLVAVPGFAFLLILAVMLLIVGALFPWGTLPFSSAINTIAWVLGTLVNLSAQLPFASMRVPSLGIWTVWISVAGIAIFIVGLASRRAMWVAVGILMAGNALVWDNLLSSDSPICVVSFIDVENGDATLITAGSKSVLVDAGPAFCGWSAADRIVPELARRGIDRLDALIVTHPDNDHIGGAAELLTRITVEQIYTNGARAQSRTFVELETGAQMNNRELTQLSAGDVIPLTTEVKLIVISPDSTLMALESDDNRKSLVILLDAGQTSLLLPADIDSSVESGLAAWGKMLNVAIIKTPHHGSESSTSKKLLELTTPETAVISSGERNPFGHPSSGVLARLASRGIRVHQTSTEGTLSFETNGDGWSLWSNETHDLVSRWKLPS